MSERHYLINCRGQILDLSRPKIMGILNATPDSFFAASRAQTLDQILEKAETMLADGATILDIGGQSTRPGAEQIDSKTERERVVPAIAAIKKRWPETLISIDTYNKDTAREAVAAGAVIVNDVSAGRLDDGFLEAIAELRDVPYILMHMQKRPETMQNEPIYSDIAVEILDFFIEKVGRLRALGQRDIILDVGFGFGKTAAHNFELLRKLKTFSTILDLPVLVGLSRKTMIWRSLGIKPEAALNGTTALNMAALERGASILRVHDVREAVECIRLFELLKGSKIEAN